MVNDSQNPEVTYQQLFDRYSYLGEKTRKTRDFVSNLRLVTVACALIGAVAAYRLHHQALMTVSMIAGAMLFSALAIWHAALFRKYDEYSALVAINRHGIDRCHGRWSDFPEHGGEFVNNAHPYSSDLDLFGQGSLYQYLSCTHTWYGKQSLVELLDGGTGTVSKETIIARQEAIKELAHNLSWRQMFECYGYNPDVAHNPEKLIAWGEGGTSGGIVPVLYKVASLLPLATVTVLIVAYLRYTSILPAIPFIILQTVLSLGTAPHNLRLFNIFETKARAFSVYSRLMKQITLEHWSTPLLQKYQSVITGGTGAAVALRRLSSVVAASEVRLSPLSWFVANALTMWDIRCVCKLMAWKNKHGNVIRHWFEAAGVFEALSSLALLHYDNPSWVFPEIKKGSQAIDARAMGHPLLPSPSRIVNDCCTGAQPGAVGIITGSNMSGKSTFLRTIGCNLVLAYAGAPVCAERFTCGIVLIFTSMRTGDDLLSHTSTFYAELLRIKNIVDAARKGHPMLYLLDELFRGTNSADRHDGAVALVNKLSLPHTLGFIATHDMDLCLLEQTRCNVTNYHFKEHYKNGGIRFDYRLCNGPSTTRNALYLMRMVGIDIPETEAI